MAYPKVSIHNSTEYYVSGEVKYMSAFCSNDDYQVHPNHTWVADGRGVCLLTEITATIHTPDKDIQATPYTSSGTSYSQFAVIHIPGNAYAVTRIVTVTEDEIPDDYVEPTEKQK